MPWGVLNENSAQRGTLSPKALILNTWHPYVPAHCRPTPPNLFRRR